MRWCKDCAQHDRPPNPPSIPDWQGRATSLVLLFETFMVAGIGGLKRSSSSTVLCSWTAEGRPAPARGIGRLLADIAASVRMVACLDIAASVRMVACLDVGPRGGLTGHQMGLLPPSALPPATARSDIVSTPQNQRLLVPMIPKTQLL